MHWIVDLLENVAYWLAKVVYDWQTLFAGLLAIVAAFIGGRFINQQIRASEKQAASEKLAKLKAARAVLPLTLSYVSGYAQSSARALMSIRAQGINGDIRTDFQMPMLPSPPAGILQLRKIVEFGNSQIGDVIAELISRIQVHEARLIGLERRREDSGGRVFTVDEVEGYILDAAEISARAGALYDYARRRSETVPVEIDLNRIARALNNFDLFIDGNPSLHEMASRRWHPLD